MKKLVNMLAGGRNATATGRAVVYSAFGTAIALILVMAILVVSSVAFAVIDATTPDLEEDMDGEDKAPTVVSIEYKNGEPGDDIYVTVSKDGAEYSFCVERYLTDPDTAVYKAVGELKAGDTVDIDGFLYWYEGVNTHITAVTKK